MSLDGYIAGPNDGPANPGGDDFLRLHEWYGFGPDGPGPNGRGTGQGLHFLDEIKATGAVVAGAKYPLVTYVTDGIASAMAQAKAAAARAMRSEVAPRATTKPSLRC